MLIFYGKNYIMNKILILIFSFFDNKILDGHYIDENQSLTRLINSRKSLIRWGDGESKIFIGGDLYFQRNSLKLCWDFYKLIHSNYPSIEFAIPNKFINCDKSDLLKINK